MSQAKTTSKRKAMPKPKLPSGIKVLRGPMAAAARKRLSGPDITTSGGTHIVQRKS